MWSRLELGRAVTAAAACLTLAAAPAKAAESARLAEIKGFSGPITPALPASLAGSALISLPPQVVKTVVALEPANAAPQRLAQLATIGRPWDARNLEVARLPISIGRLSDPTAFSAMVRPGVRAQSMAIKLPGTEVRLPSELAQFREVVDRVVSFERAINPLFDGSRIYLTFSQGEVEPGKTQRRANAHTDGWPRDTAGEKRPVDRAYVVSDALPTEFFDQTFAPPRGAGFSEVHDALEQQTDPTRIVTHAPHEVLMMDGYTVHRSPAATQRLRRTFLKLHVTTADFGMAKNTPNPLFAQAAATAAAPLPTGGSATLRERLREEWADYLHRRAAASAGAVVSDPKAMFAELFNIGKLWWTSTRWGPRVSSVALEPPARRAARLFFSASPALRRAADSFVDRALDPARGDSANQRRKLLRETFLAASTLPAEKATAMFDEAARSVGVDAIARRRYSAATVARFGSAAERIIEHRLSLAPSFNVVGVAVAGSYVEGTARPGSDLDFVALTRDGTTRDVLAFREELAYAAPAEGWPPTPDWERFSNVMKPDSSLRAFTRERPARVFSPLAGVRAAASTGRTLEQGSRLDSIIYGLTAPFLRLWVRRQLD